MGPFPAEFAGPSLSHNEFLAALELKAASEGAGTAASGEDGADKANPGAPAAANQAAPSMARTYLAMLK